MHRTILSSFLISDRYLRLLQSEAFFGEVGVRLMKSPIPVQLVSVTRLFFFQFTPCKIPNFPIGVGAVGEWGGIGVGVGREIECESDSCPTSVSTPKAARGGGDTGVQSYQETPD